MERVKNFFGLIGYEADTKEIIFLLQKLLFWKMIDLAMNVGEVREYYGLDF